MAYHLVHYYNKEKEMKNVLITIDKDTRIKVVFSGGPVTHRELKLLKRAIDVEFRVYHHKLTNKMKNEIITKQELKNG